MSPYCQSLSHLKNKVIKTHENYLCCELPKFSLLKPLTRDVSDWLPLAELDWPEENCLPLPPFDKGTFSKGPETKNNNRLWKMEMDIY